MAKNKSTKSIDVNQFILNDKGNIAWKKNLNKKFFFLYNDETHSFVITKIIDKKYASLIIDDAIFIDRIATSMIKNLSFDKYFYKPKYKFDIGDIHNELKVLSQIKIKRKTIKGAGIVNVKGYLVKCIIDGYEFKIFEDDLLHNHGCPVCSNKKVMVGVNNVGFTDPDIIKYLVNYEDANLYTRKSMKKVLVRCPFCGSQKYMSVAELTKQKRVTCDKCSDGISYPNKFAHALFNQLSNQYLNYIPEYTPEWAGKYRYDNYIEFKNGDKIIVEMDGGYHKTNENSAINDNIKDLLAENHGIQMIRIDCDYIKIEKRFSLIKENLILALKNYFDLSLVNWDECNRIGTSSIIMQVGEFYNLHPYASTRDIMKKFSILSKDTLLGYLKICNDLGICIYNPKDYNRINNSKPVSMYSINGEFIGCFKSSGEIEKYFPEHNFSSRSIRYHINKNLQYNGFIFHFISYEEYKKFKGEK